MQSILTVCTDENLGFAAVGEREKTGVRTKMPF